MIPHPSLPRPRLIITADDFGRDAECTVEIAQSLSTGAVTSASIMANGTHFEEACALARNNDLVGKIGVHLSLDEGPPLSTEMTPYLDTHGHLCVRRSLMPHGAAFSKAVHAELAAQIERVVSCGICPTHLDSHRHVHTVFSIGRLVVRLAKQYRIDYVRPARNLASHSTAAAGVYKWAFNRYLASNVATADHFGDLVDFYNSQNEHTVTGLIECMVHLDNSPRGLAARSLLKSDGFRRFLEQYDIVAHAEIGH